MNIQGLPSHSFHNETDEESIYKLTKSTIKLKTDLEACTILNKDLISKIQGDFKQSELLITKLKNEKIQLKQALSDTYNKKEELYSKMLEYREELNVEKKKNQDLLIKLDEIGEIKAHIHELNSIMTAKEQQCEGIIKENHSLRENLEKLEIEASSWKELYEANKTKDTKYASAKDNGELDIEIHNVWNSAIRKLQKDSEFYSIFKKNASGLSYFSELLEGGKWKEALFRSLCILNDILTPQEINVSKSVQTTEEETKPKVVHKMQKTPTFTVSEIKQIKIDAKSDCSSQVHYPRSETPEHIIKDREELLQSLAKQNQKLLQLNQQIYDTMSQENGGTAKKRSKWSGVNSEASLSAEKYELFDEKECVKIDRDMKMYYDDIENEWSYPSSEDSDEKSKNQRKGVSRIKQFPSKPN
ncbi:unnamed protein product [Blepharisma stoltei]|uniref:Uncharacterized protein n=1 Tax=Blepharisma stoltei TaxID=1481888 RepID=A0AAU9KGQ9_9CILI|nr:unnamed protein product [Blepharisma stoltei]